MAVLTGSEINLAVMEMKRKGRKVKSNVYTAANPSVEYDVAVTPETLVYLEEDHGIKRLKLYTVSAEDLQQVLERIPGPVTTDVITKDSEDLMCEMQNAGYTLLARMRRLVNRDITDMMKSMEPSDDPMVGSAHIEDAEAINRLLWEVFDTRVSHLLSDSELFEAIKRGEVFAVKEQGKIVTVLQRTIERNQFYINQVINRSDSFRVHSLLKKELFRFYENGGRYLYAWVQDSNIASNKFHAKYGMIFDGLYDLVYTKE